MPMEANSAAMSMGIRPVSRPQSPAGSEGVHRREDGSGSSGFSPRTNVTIKNAVDNMANILSKISTNQEEGVERIPQDLQKVVQNVMKQAFSMQETLGQGIGSTLESQRFSMEQLTALSRMLTQMGNLAEKGFSMEISDNMQALLTNLKAYVTAQADGNYLEPVLLNKAAFELLNDRGLESLPEIVQLMVSGTAAAGSMASLGQTEDGSPMAFLKQLVQYFMPRSSEGTQMPPMQGQTQAQGQMQQGQMSQGWQGEASQAQQGAPMPQMQGQAQAQGQMQGQMNQGWQGEMPQAQQGTQMPPMQGQTQAQGQMQGQMSQSWQGEAPQAQQGTQMQPMQGQAQAQGQMQGQMNQGWQGEAPQSQQGAQMPQMQGQAQAQGQMQGQMSQGWQGEASQVQQGTQIPQMQEQAQATQGQMQGQMSQGWQGEVPQAQQGAQMQPMQGQAQAQGQMQGQMSQGWQGEAPQAQQGTPMPQMQGQAQVQGQMQGQSAQGQPQGQTGQGWQGDAPQAQGQAAQGWQGNMAQRPGAKMPRQAFLRQGQYQGAPQNAQQPVTPKQQSPVRQAQAQFMRNMIENTPETMAAMKGTAQMLLRGASLTQGDALLLQSFVNGQQALLAQKEARQLQTLLRLCQQNVPATIQQAALQQNLPDLPRLWAFMQLCDFAVAKRMNARQLKNAGKEVGDFVTSMRQSMGGDNSSVHGQRSLNFMLPLYMGDNEKGYPSYIHVYDEDTMEPETGEWKKETWLRLCVLTDNIGAVELTCRVYEGQQLDMRLFFSSHEVAEEFREYVGEFKDSMQDSPLHLNEFKIGAVGERRFM